MRGLHLLRSRAVRSGRLQRDHGVEKTIAALDQFFQPLGEACCWCAIDDIVIEADRQTQIVTYRDLPVNDPRFLANATYCHHERCRRGYWDAPARTVLKYAYCRETHRPHVLLP